MVRFYVNVNTSDKSRGRTEYWR